ncbi:MAG: preQ(1) synthase [Pseudomonadota bacterium]|nr:preQ(1) synthase [Pseudomonadota bacterium]
MVPTSAHSSQAVPSLTQLGRHVDTPDSPEAAVIERVPNVHPETPYVARFACPEFTALCLVTGQPDFAHLVIDYVPKQWLLESKSLKLFLHAHRNYRSFHEACTVGIGKRLVQAIEPHYLRIGAYWYPRGGMPIDVFFQAGELPAGVWLPDQGIAPYRGRG